MGCISNASQPLDVAVVGGGIICVMSALGLIRRCMHVEQSVRKDELR